MNASEARTKIGKVCGGKQLVAGRPDFGHAHIYPKEYRAHTFYACTLSSCYSSRTYKILQLKTKYVIEVSSQHV
jgi:hypothetical protein